MKTWLKEPFPLTNGVAIVAGLMLGLLGATGILLGARAGDDVADEKVRATGRADVADRDIQEITRRVEVILREIRAALRECRSSPRCLSRLEALERAEGDAVDRAVARGRELARPREPSPQDPAGQPPGRQPREPGGSPPEPSPRDPGDPSPPDPPQTPRPPIDVRVPDIGPVQIPPVCTDLVAVNC